jgi:hypothetical protein
LFDLKRDNLNHIVAMILRTITANKAAELHWKLG